jgi:curved DNA-binding protein CbpA
MKGSSQLLIAIRLLSTTEKFSAQLSLFLESGRIYLYCFKDQVLFVELGDLFPASWLAQNGKGVLAGKIRTAQTNLEKVQHFREISEAPELKDLFVGVVKKHLSEFLSSELKKCEMKSDTLIQAPALFSLSEMLTDCAGPLLTSFRCDDLLSNNDVSFQLAPDYVERSTRLKINLQQGYLLSRLEQPHTVQEIVPTVPAGEDVTKRNLLILWAYGILNSSFLNRLLPRIDAQAKPDSGTIRVPIAERVTDEVQKQIEMIDQTYLSLSHKDYYTLLGVTSKADLAQIKAAYYRLARKFHPDRFYGLDDVVLKEKIDIIFSTINVAYETMKNSRARHMYDSSSMDDRRISPATIMQDARKPTSENVAKVAEDYFQRAQKSYSSRNFYEAVQFLRSATQIAPEIPKYWRQLGIALSKNDQWRKEAEDSFNRAIELEPQNSENYLYLAFLYRNSNLRLRAKRCFMKVLELDPKNDVARDQIDQIETEESGSQKKGLRDLFKKK